MRFIASEYLTNPKPAHTFAYVSTIQRTISGSLSHREALKVARDWAPLLELTVSEFIKMRKNE
jgi:hypothetical protein